MTKQMNETLHRPTSDMTKAEVIEKFETTLKDTPEQFPEMSEIEELVALYAKDPTDNYMVTDSARLKYPVKQGDILLSHESSNYYKKVISTLSVNGKAQNMNLQEGTSITGDHCVVPLEGSKLTIEDGTFLPPDNITRGRRWRCKIIHADKPFLIKHQEHGNIACGKGDYLVRTAIDPKDLEQMLD